MKSLQRVVKEGIRKAKGAVLNHWAPFLFCAISMAANALLAVQTIRFGRTIEAIRRENRLVEGKKIYEMAVVDARGRPVTFPFVKARPTVLYAAVEECEWCAGNRSWIESIHSSIGGQYDFVGVCLDGTPPGGCSSWKPPRAPFFYSPGGLGGEMLKLEDAPQIAVISSAGQVVLYFKGADTERFKAYIDRLSDALPAGSAKE